MNNVSVRDACWIAITEGVRVGVVLSACVAVLAAIGLSPSMAWVPEPPLLTFAVLLPVVAFGLAGYRTGMRSGRALAGAIAGGVAGAISGTVGGLAYVFFGKPTLNVALGLLLGATGGSIIGASAAHVSRHRVSRV